MKVFKIFALAAFTLIAANVAMAGSPLFTVTNKTNEAVGIHVAACGSDQYGSYCGQATNSSLQAIASGATFSFNPELLSREHSGNVKPSYFEVTIFSGASLKKLKHVNYGDNLVFENGDLKKSGV